MRRGLDRPERMDAERAGSEFARQLLRTGAPVATPDAALDLRLSVEDRCPGLDAGPAVYVPLRQRVQTTAYLAVFRRRGTGRFSAEEIHLVTLLPGHSGC